MAKIGKPRTSKGLAVFCAKVAESKLASDTLILDFTEIESAPSDYFVIASCDSDVQLKALADELERMRKDAGLQKPRTEGTDALQWVLIDFFDVVVHFMLRTVRNFYKIEKLWGDAKFYKLNENGRPVVYKTNKFKELYREEF